MRTVHDRPTASELRRDPILRRWVIVAPERTGDLPSRRAVPVASVPEAECPMCPGAEKENPVEIARVAHGGEWRIRVTPDRHPLLRIEGGLDQRAVGMFDNMNAVGAHELVVDTAEHARTWADFSPPHMARLLGVYRDRDRDRKIHQPGNSCPVLLQVRSALTTRKQRHVFPSAC